LSQGGQITPPYAHKYYIVKSTPPPCPWSQIT
jgi:hypothetical protein